jgi:hypothetical protein
LRNDVGLLVEKHDSFARRHLGNFPQAFSYLALIDRAHNPMSTNGCCAPAFRSQQLKSLDGERSPAVALLAKIPKFESCTAKHHG